MLRLMSAAIAVLCLLATPASALINTERGLGVLSAKVAELKAACGARVISAHRRNARTPSGHVSEHALGRAVDVTGNYSCIYSRLRSWPGGYSTDAAAVGHVHISYGPGGREWGQRFRHAAGTARARGRGGIAARSPRNGGPRLDSSHTLQHGLP